MIHYKTPAEIELMRDSAQLVSKTLTEVAKVLKPGMTTLELDKLIADFIRDNGAIPSFLNYRGYPFASCTSVNDVVVHGFPNGQALREGDIVSIDIGVIKKGYHGDHAYTFAIGDPGPEIMQLIRVTREPLSKGMAKAVAGGRGGVIPPRSRAGRSASGPGCEGVVVQRYRESGCRRKSGRYLRRDPGAYGETIWIWGG